MTIVDAHQVNVEFTPSSGKSYNFYSDPENYIYDSIYLFDTLPSRDTYFYYEGLYGNSSHINGGVIQPFFLFLNGTGQEYIPVQVNYNSSTHSYTAKFFIDLPQTEAFSIGISFSTVYLHTDISENEYNWFYLSNSNTINSPVFRL